jgi:hypothetical protein
MFARCAAWRTATLGHPEFELFVWSESEDAEGHVVIFKIGAYDLDLQYASLDLVDPNVTCRVMT